MRLGNRHHQLLFVFQHADYGFYCFQIQAESHGFSGTCDEVMFTVEAIKAFEANLKSLCEGQAETIKFSSFGVNEEFDFQLQIASKATYFVVEVQLWMRKLYSDDFATLQVKFALEKLHIDSFYDDVEEFCQTYL